MLDGKRALSITYLDHWAPTAAWSSRDADLDLMHAPAFQGASSCTTWA